MTGKRPGIIFGEKNGHPVIISNDFIFVNNNILLLLLIGV